MKRFYSFFSLCLCFCSSVVWGQINLTATGGSYSENFNSMTATGTALPAGWSAVRLAGTGTNGQALTPVVTTGTANSGAVYNVGAAAAADRALGTLASGSTAPAFGVSFINNTGSNINSFQFAAVSEQWRTGTSNAIDEIVFFEYSTDATSLTTGTWTAVASFNLTEVLTTTITAAAVDGNAASNKVAVSGNISTINVANGSTVWLRWRDRDDAGSDGLYALDDFSMQWTNSAISNTVSIAAGNAAAEPATAGTFTVTSSTPAPAGGITVTYALSGIANQTDYTNPQNGTVVIPEGANNATITLPVTDDAVVEGTEFIRASLTSVTSPYTIEENSALIAIADDEATTLYSYPFTDCSVAVSDGFIQQSITGIQTWRCSSFGRSGNGVEMNGFSSGNNENEDWLISPLLDLTGTDVPLLQFYSRTRFNGEPLQLYITTNFTGDVTTTAWTELNGFFPGENSDVWTASQINLAQFKQQHVRFAFKYRSSAVSAARWTLDEISILNTNISPAPSFTINRAPLDFRIGLPGTRSPAKTTRFWANNLTADVTISAPAGFEVSKNNIDFATSISYTTVETTNQQQTFFTRFAPTAINTVYSGYVQFSSGGLQENAVFVKGNSYPDATTLNVVNWNIEWFGSPNNGQGPTNDALAQANAKKIMDYLNADVYAVAEIVDTVRLGNLTRSLADNYNYVVADFASGNYASGQKLGFVYKTSVVSNVTARGMLQSSPAAVSNWSSGRVPFLMHADVTKNGKASTIDFIVVHAKANTGTTADQIESYQRRKAGVQELKDTLDQYFSEANIILLGDFNDDLDRTIAPTTDADTVSSYQVLLADSTDENHYKAVTLPLSLLGLSSTAENPEMIDHVMISNELGLLYLEQSASLFNDIGELANVEDYAGTTSDHYPVLTRYIFERPYADIAVEKTAPDSVLVASNVTYTITVKNNGAATANGVVLTDTLPQGTTFQSITTPQNWLAQTPAIDSTGVVTITTATLPASGEVQFSITVKVDSSLPNNTVLTNTAFVSSSTADSVLSNNSSSASTVALACVLTCPENVIAVAEEGKCGADVFYPAPVSTFGCGTLTTSHASGSFFPVGTTVVTVSTSTGDSCSFTVIVKDSIAPIISNCPGVATFCATGSNNYTIPALVAADNCGDVGITYTITGATSRTGTGNASGLFNAGTSIISWTATDNTGNTATCQTTVVVHASPVVTIPDGFRFSLGMLPNTVYVGYEPASLLLLSSNTSGGMKPYRYSWSTGSTAPLTLVAPTVATNYTVVVTDANGCTDSAVKSIAVIDVRGGKGGDKVVLCHKQGNQNKTWVVDKKDVAGHLLHGDMLGSCAAPVNAVTATTASPDTEAIMEKQVLQPLVIKATPNPSSNHFTIRLQGGYNEEKVSVVVTDMWGRRIEAFQNKTGTASLVIGSTLR